MKKQLTNETMLLLVENAKKIGLNLDQTLQMVKEVWIQAELPTELPDEVEFRMKAKRFVENHYDNLLNASKEYCDRYCTYKTVKVFYDKSDNEKFWLETICSIYKGFKMKSFDKKEMKKLNVERTRVLFPWMTTKHKKYFDSVYRTLLRYAYEFENEKISVLEKQYYQAETVEEKGIVRLIGMVILEV